MAVLFCPKCHVRYKWCSHCMKTRPVEMFHKNRARKDGRDGWCIICVSKRSSRETQQAEA